jgi:hypothetical protein
MQAKTSGQPQPANPTINQPAIFNDRTNEPDKWPVRNLCCDRAVTAHSGCSFAQDNIVMHKRSPAELPDPWLFDSEKLLRELDRCRELVLLIPAPTHETHFAINTAVDAIWNLSQNLRYLLHLHRDGQRRFAALHPPQENTNAKELREQQRVDILRKAGQMKPAYETALERQKRERSAKILTLNRGKRKPKATTKSAVPARMAKRSSLEVA